MQYAKLIANMRLRSVKVRYRRNVRMKLDLWSRKYPEKSVTAWYFYFKCCVTRHSFTIWIYIILAWALMSYICAINWETQTMGFKLLCCSWDSQMRPSVSHGHGKCISLYRAWGRQPAREKEGNCIVCLLHCAELGLCGGFEACVMFYWKLLDLVNTAKF